MVPPEEIEKNKPTTLPADFAEWDSGESEGQKESKPSRFNGFEAAPRTPVVSRPQVKPAAARVAVAAVEERAPKPAPRPAAKPFERTEKVAPPAPPRSVAVESYDQDDAPSGGKGKMIAIGGVAVLVVALGGVGYLKMRPAKTASAPQVATSQTTVVNEPMSPAVSGSNTPKPSAASPSAASTPSTTDTSAATGAGATPQATPQVRTQMMDHQLAAPSRIPDDLKMMAGREAPSSAGFAAPGMESMANTSSAFGGQAGPNVRSAPPSKVTISAGIAGGLLVKRNPPVYPQIAKEARVSGSVVIQATISKNGKVENARVVNGPTMLRQAALDAVKTWRYRPYLLDGQPVEVETTVDVVFSLAD